MQGLAILVVGVSGNASMRGVERVVYESVKSLAKHYLGRGIERIDLLCGDWQGYYFDLKDLGVNVISAPCTKSLLSRHLYLWGRLQFLARKYDVVHLMNTMPYFSFFSERRIVTLHDVAEFACPGKYSWFQSLYRRFVTRFVSRFVDGLITVSGFSQGQIKIFLGRNSVVATNGLDHFGCSMNKADFLSKLTVVTLDGRRLSIDILDANYFLYFGVIEKTKGLDVALSSFSRLKRQGRLPDETKFLVAGAPGNLYSSLGQYLERDDVLFLGRVDDDSLQSLILHSSCVVFLSEYEGFGFPAPEAVVLGAKVLVPEGSVFHEVCGEYCYPCSVKEVEFVDDSMLNAFSAEVNWSPLDACESLHRKYSWESVARILFKEYSK